MNSIYVCFNLKSVPNSLESNEILEKDYQAVYKPLIKFLYSHPEFPFSFSFSGLQIQFYKKRKNELITILRELIERKQLEVLGGGYYDPVLPLLYPVDRNGQIDMLSAEIRQTMGKRPRGITVFADCWDSSLVNNIHTCGIDFVLLDENLIQENKRKFLPIIMTDLNKSVDIYPYYDEFIPNPELKPEDFVNLISSSVEKIDRKDKHFQLEVNRVININISHNKMIELLNAKWFENLNKYLKTLGEQCPIKISNVEEYKKSINLKIPAYISTGIGKYVSKWIDNSLSQKEKSSNRQYSFFDFMDSYPSSHALYNKIMYTSMLVNQYKGDKMRKKAAREKLWQAQNGAAILCSEKGDFSSSKYRQQAYKYLTEAEKILNEDGKLKNSITRFDYDNDGLNEYVCRMDNFFACISLISGSIQELEVLKNTGNYADNLQRSQKYEGITDDYKRGLFIDHFFTQEQFEQYILNNPAGNGIFSKIQYSELKFSQKHHEVQMEAQAFWTSDKKINLIKKYIITETGMNVQYIIKNLSDQKISAVFAVESNFANTNFNSENIIFHNIQLVDNNDKIEIDSQKGTSFLLNQDKLMNISTARITDTQSGVSFVFEPNENCGYSYNPILFKRPEAKTQELKVVDLTSVSTLFWKIEIDAGMETEKYINFSIISTKKSKK